MKTNNTKIKNRSGKTVFKSLALAGLMLGFLSFLPNSVKAQLGNPFVCESTEPNFLPPLFLSQNLTPGLEPVTLTILDYSINPFGVSNVTGPGNINGDNHGFNYNAIGYNTNNNYIYGVDAETFEILQIGDNGIPISMGQANPPLPSLAGGRYYIAGDMIGHVLYVMGRDDDDNIIFAIDIANGLAKSRITLDEALNVADIAWNPVTEVFYGVERTATGQVGKLAAVAVDFVAETGVVEFLGQESSLFQFGAMYADAEGKIFGNLNSGGFYQFNPVNGVRTLISNTNDARINDGAFCSNATLEFETELTVDKVVVDGLTYAYAGDVIQFEVVVENIGEFGTSDVVVIDNVPSGIPSANVTYYAEVEGGATTTVSTDSGTPDTGNINDEVDMPKDSKITYFITVVIPGDFESNDWVGQLLNCASVSYEFLDDPDVPLEACAEVLVNPVITGSCWRMLSSPVVGLNYEQMLAPLGITSTNFPLPDGYDYIYSWPVGDAVVNSDAQWVHEADLSQVVSPYEGFIVSTPANLTYPIGLEVSGTEHPDNFVFSHDNGNQNNGWILLGNPFQSFIDIASIFDNPNTSGIAEAVYIWDSNYIDGVPSSNPNQDPETYGSWRVWTRDGGGIVTSDIVDDKISPFQGFFVEMTDPSITVDFENTKSVSGGEGGLFYGKDDVARNMIRLNLSGEGLFNTTVINFTESGSLDRVRGDAYELQPLSAEYAIISSVKSDNILYTVANFPVPENDIEIPVGINVTRAGDYTVSASELNISFNGNLYFNDLREGVSILIDENFEYNFSTNQLAKVEVDDFGCTVAKGLEKAIASDLSNRFVISSSPAESAVNLPVEIALMQNYPNPFNPSTVIEYNLPEQSDVTLAIYDMLGRRIATLVNETQAAGRYQVSWDANGISSGSYLYRLEAGGKTITRQMTFIK